jgi:hypothetical protein
MARLVRSIFRGAIDGPDKPHGRYSAPQVGWDARPLPYRHAGRRPDIHAFCWDQHRKAWMAGLRRP